MSEINRKWTDGMLTTEDWWAVWLGLLLFGAGLMSIWGIDLVGWMAKTKTWEWSTFWSDPSFDGLLKAAHGKAGKAYEGMGGLASLLVTFAVFGSLTTIGAYFQKLDVKKFFYGFTLIFFITWASWMAGHEAHFKAAKTSQSMTQSEIYGSDVYCLTKVNKCTKKINKALKKLGVDVSAGQVPTKEQAAQAVDDTKKAMRLSWGLQLGGGFSYILSLIVGLFIGNLMKGFAGFLKEAAKPEWYIKTAIVYLGVKLGHMSIKSAGDITGGGSLMLDLALTGAAATFVAYLTFWPIVYTLGRKVFKLKRDASAVLASGISICGVSAAIATAGAIRAKPILPIAVSMLIVVFAMIELIVLPAFYAGVAPDQPLVNGAALGMTVKTDGADAAAGAILDELMVANNYIKTGVLWEEDWILAAAVLTKIWIDVFIGVWAFVLALIWVYKVEKKPGESHVGLSEIWFRFPKFVLGYFVAWLTYVAIVIWFPESAKAADAGAKVVQSPMRKMMFMLTFVAIGVISDFSKLKGMGRLTLLYAVALFGIIAPIAYGVAYIFHNGLVPPVVS
ncbi:MAG: putative sulfate exporter family transporter, partial [Gammaproteobacteria bacterium]